MSSSLTKRKPLTEPSTDVSNPQNEKAQEPAGVAQEPRHCPSRKGLSLLQQLLVALILLAAGCFASWRIYGCWPFLSGPRVFSKAELSHYVGKSDSALYLAILGEVFDVTKGRRFYAADKGYGFFVGRDASRAFVTGDFEGDLTDDVADLSPEQIKSIVEWRDFYHKTYTYKGRLEGPFHDARGRPTGHLRWVEQQAARAKSAEEQQRELEAQWPSCNVRWTESEGSTVWCEGGAYPRKLISTLPGGSGGPAGASGAASAPGKTTTSRCACFEEVGWSDVRQLYAGCPPDQHSCKILEQHAS
ncbi:hypothetical protein Agub_g2847 [Astrephomene gubernaculifera]|uniref:Cytochrome b5 heme-binding domain-containing protein n=1 Tax=Astrephomene gubernaculifera TaxID=47775 RepID=A0AAD3DHQ2_9CHLO|nr:hypothetical protein Agub_g2847 [Astrephomene gubernaculifera]